VLSMTRTALIAFCMVAGLVGCETTSLRPPERMGRFQVEPTDVGLDVRFMLFDAADEPTTVMLGSGVIRIEDPGIPFSASSSNQLDTARTLYNRQLILSSEFFVKQTTEEGRERVPVCQLGVFPYRHFRKPPVSREGLVRLVVVVGAGKTLLVDSALVRWPDHIYEDRELFGSSRPAFGGG